MRVKIRHVFKEKETEEKKVRKSSLFPKSNQKEEKKKYVIDIPLDEEEDKEKETNILELEKRQGSYPRVRKGAATPFSSIRNEEKKEREEKVQEIDKVSEGTENISKKKLKKQYYFLLIGMLVLAGTSLYLSNGSAKYLNQENYDSFNGEEVAVSSSIQNEGKQEENSGGIEQDNASSNQDTRKEENETKTQVQNTSATTTPKEKVTTPVVKPLSFAKPIEGEVLKLYSIDKVIYSKTLELWKTHDGIDIKANIGTTVKSIEKGIVEKVYEDAFLGMTVVIDHGQGYKSSYSNLATNTNVKVKQSVIKGQKIGTISNTAIGEIKDEPHLHFMLFKNNEITDPSSIFK